MHQENAEDDAHRHLLRGNNVGVGRVNRANGRIIERMAQAEREDAQTHNCRHRRQWVSVAKGKKERDRQQPQGRDTVDIRGVTKQGMPFTFTAAHYRIDAKAESGEQRDTIAENHTVSRSIE